MKKVIAVLIMAAGLYSCKKESTVNQQPSTWISGTWKRTVYIDTIFTSNSNTTVGGIDNFSVSLNPNELTFSSATDGNSTARGAFNYSLTSATLVYGAAPALTWHIVQINSTEFKLTTSYAGEGWGDTYVKQ
ncbi:MAG TPA: hypothetical protein VFE53_19765 [Mucilaginibacter sp.]|nr:hypothetical protein [Mucilaginibacter sp.]